MVYVIVPKHYKVNPETVYIVYDVDDTLWDFVGKLCQILGIDYSEWTEFYITKHTMWSQVVKDAVCELLSDERMWQNMKFYDGIKDIMRPCQDFGVNLQLNTNSNSISIQDSKRSQLLAAIPGLRDENLKLNIIIPNQPSVKTLPDNTAIFVDDNPYHIAGSTARFDVMPKCPWNTSKDGLTVLGNRPVTKLDNLQQINDFVYRRVKFYLEFAC